MSRKIGETSLPIQGVTLFFCSIVMYQTPTFVQVPSFQRRSPAVCDKPMGHPASILEVLIHPQEFFLAPHRHPAPFTGNHKHCDGDYYCIYTVHRTQRGCFPTLAQVQHRCGHVTTSFDVSCAFCNGRLPGRSEAAMDISRSMQTGGRGLRRVRHDKTADGRIHPRAYAGHEI